MRFPFNFSRFLQPKIRFFDGDTVADVKIRVFARRQVLLAGCRRSHESAYSRRSTFESAYLSSLSLSIFKRTTYTAATFA